MIEGVTDSAAADIERAQVLTEQTLTAAPHSWLAHFAKGQVLRAQNRFEEAILEYETVLAINRNSVFALYVLSDCKLHAGSIEDSIPLVEQALRLGPRDPQLGLWYAQIGQAHLLQSRTQEAIVWLEKARGAMPAHPNTRASLASAYALKGETEGPPLSWPKHGISTATSAFRASPV